MTAFTSMCSDEPIGAEEEQQIFCGKFVKIRSRRDGVPLVEIRVGKLIEGVSPNEWQKCFAEEPWQVRGTHTQPTAMMAIEVTTYEKEIVGMRG